VTGAASLGVRLALRFPTSSAVAAPYAFLFLPLAIWNDNPELDFLVQTGALAVGSAFVVELAVALVLIAGRSSGRIVTDTGPSLPPWHGGRVAVVARVVTVVSVLANLSSLSLGGGTLSSQVAGAGPTAVLSLLSPFVSWAWVSVALIISAHSLGGLSRWAALRWMTLLVATQALAAYVSNLTARPTAFLVLLLTLLFLTRLVPWTWIAASVAVLAVIWPTVFAIRNEQRVANGVDVDDSVSAFDRVRFDELIVRAQQYGPGPDLGQPGLWDVLRYGLVPRFLDPDRPSVSSGFLVNVFMGGSSFSADHFLPVATAWFFWGGLATALIYAGYAVIVLGLRPWHRLADRPFAIVTFAIVLGGPLGWFVTTPDAPINALQTLVSVTPVFLTLRLWARRPSSIEQAAPPERSRNTRESVCV
jgi:hypothetical protein